MKDWKLSNAMISHVRHAMTVLLAIQEDQIKPMILFNAGRKAILTASRVAEFEQLQHPDLLAMNDQLPIHDRHDLAIDGGALIRHTSIQPGPLLGNVINQLLVLVVEGKVANEGPALLQEAKNLIEKG